jgi:hypothetical protein
MSKNIFNKTDAEEIIARAQQLNPGSKPNWGSMTVTEMLHHCNTINKKILEGNPNGKRSTLKQQLIKILVLHITKHIPKNIKIKPNSHHKKAPVPADNFEEEKKKFATTIREFSETQKPIQGSHPILGKLSRKEWGIFTWLHMDHHLRQYGV